MTPNSPSSFKPLSAGIPKSFAILQAMLDNPETKWRPEDPSPCDNPECDGDGNVIRTAPDGHETASRCPDCLRRWHNQETDEKMQSWEGWQTVPSFEKMSRRPRFVQTESFKAMRRLSDRILAKQDPFAYTLIGGHGRSKTYSAMILFKTIRNASIPSMAIKFPNLIAAYKRGLDGSSFLEATYFAMQKNQLIILDEVGRDQTPGSDTHTKAALNEILDLCYRLRFLVLISNRTPDEFYKLLPSGVESRLKNQDYCHIVIEPTGLDLRRKT